MNLPEMGNPTRAKRFAAIALSVAVALGVATAVAVPLVGASVSPVTSTTKAPPKAPKPLAMGSYPTSKYADDAAKLPEGLVTALKRDLNLTAAEYLANSAAAIQAPKVVAALKAAGVHVLGSSIKGTKLTINVSKTSEKSLVTLAGARAVVGAPKVRDFSTTHFRSASTTNTYGGQGYFYQEAGQQNGDGFRCSIGFNGYAKTNGAPQFVTAGHCATDIPNGNSAYLINQSAPFMAPPKSQPTVGIAIGSPTSEAAYGGNYDYGIISSAGTPGALVAPQGSVATWGHAQSASALSSAPLGITGETAATVGAAMCKSGSTSGWTCGSVLDVDADVQVDNDQDAIDGTHHEVNSIVANTCLLGGDSGGAAVIGTEAVGIDSGSSNAHLDTYTSSSCKSPKDEFGDPAFSAFFPMVSAAGTDSVQGQQGANWQLGLTVSTPVVTSLTSGSTVTTAQSLSGTLANSSSTSTVSLYLDGSPTATSTISASSGSWSFPIGALSHATHTYALIAASGFSKSVATSGSFTLVAAVPAAVSGGVGDFNSDGKPDIIARDSSGILWLYPGNGSTGFGTRIQLGAAATWKGMTAIAPVGDFDGDGHTDIVARDAGGTLWLYPGNGGTGLGARVQLATGWQSMTTIQGAGDFNGDAHPDILARDTSGVVWLYPGDGHGGLGAGVSVASGWQAISSIVGVGDFTNDGKSDLLVRDSAGVLDLYPGNGNGTLGTPVVIGSGWSGLAIAAVGDFDHNGTEDFVGRDSSGNLWLYRGTGSGTVLARIEIGTGWATLSLAGDGSTLAAVFPPIPTDLSGGAGDFNGDGNADIITRDSSGVVWLYRGNGSTGFAPRIQMATGWQSMTAILSAGDFNGDGHPDVITRDSAGQLWLYPGDGVSSFGARTSIGTGFGSMTMIQGVTDLNGDGHVDLLTRDKTGQVYLYPGTGTGTVAAPVALSIGLSASTAIVGVGDANGDGKADLLVRDSTGNMALYPGNGNGTFGTPISAGGGWNGFTVISIGDFNHNGTEDLLGRDSTGALWLYNGAGNGTFPTRIKVGTGWSSYTLAGSGSAIGAIVPPALSGGVGDFNGDGNQDLIARDAAGTLWLYPGNGSAGFGARVQLGTAAQWKGETAIVAVGDINADGHPDILARNQDGALFYFPGNGSNALGAPVKLVGTTDPDLTFAAMTEIQGVADLDGDGHVDVLARDASGAMLFRGRTSGGVTTLDSWVNFAQPGLDHATSIVGVGDFDGDGKSDLLARNTAGVLSLYRGDGNGGVDSGTVAGSGWNAYSIVAVGDFNHDGAIDVIGRDAAGALYLYAGTGTGTFASKLKIGSGWTGYTIAGDGSAIVEDTLPGH